MPSLSAVSHTRLSLVSQSFLVIHVCKRRPQSKATLPLFSHLTHPPLPIISLLLSIHLFVRIVPFLPAC